MNDAQKSPRSRSDAIFGTGSACVRAVAADGQVGQRANGITPYLCGLPRMDPCMHVVTRQTDLAPVIHACTAGHPRSLCTAGHPRFLCTLRLHVPNEFRVGVLLDIRRDEGRKESLKDTWQTWHCVWTSEVFAINLQSETLTK